MERVPVSAIIVLSLVLLLVFVPSAAASVADGVDLNISFGLLSGPGISYDAGSWQFGVDLETTFPIYCIVSGISGEMFDDFPFWEGFLQGFSTFIGLDFYSYYTAVDSKGPRVYVGLAVMLGSELPIKSFEAVLRPSVKLSYPVSDRTALFAAGGFSLLQIMYVPGFRKPLVKVPDFNYASVLTGCRLGVAIGL